MGHSQPTSWRMDHSLFDTQCGLRMMEFPIVFQESKAKQLLDSRSQHDGCDETDQFCALRHFPISFLPTSVRTADSKTVNTPVSHCAGPGSMWDLWQTQWHWDRFFSEYFTFPLSVPSHQLSILIFNLMLPFSGQKGNFWEPPNKARRVRISDGTEEKCALTLSLLHGWF